MDPYQPKKGDINGFSICGTKLSSSGSVELCDGRIIEAFPEEVELLGVVYTLEEVEQHGCLIWAQYV